MRLSEIIKTFRETNKLSMDDMAQRCNTSKPYISMLENEKNSKTGKPINPKAETLKKIAKGMNIELDQLIKMMDGDIEVDFKVDNPKEGLLLSYFSLLNETGQDVAISQVKTLTDQKALRKDSQSETEEAPQEETAASSAQNGFGIPSGSNDYYAVANCDFTELTKGN